MSLGNDQAATEKTGSTDPEDVVLDWFTGLRTDPAGDCCGARPWLEEVRDDLVKTGLTVRLTFTSYSDFGDQTLAKAFLADRSRHRCRVAGGHSFGGAAWVWLANMLAMMEAVEIKEDGSSDWTDFIALLMLDDPAPNADRFHQFCPWQLADLAPSTRWQVSPSVVKMSATPYQRNDLIGPFGVCGVPLQQAPPEHTSWNVSAWETSDGSDKIHHANMPAQRSVQVRHEKLLDVAIMRAFGTRFLRS